MHATALTLVGIDPVCSWGSLPTLLGACGEWLEAGVMRRRMSRRIVASKHRLNAAQDGRGSGLNGAGCSGPSYDPDRSHTRSTSPNLSRQIRLPA